MPDHALRILHLACHSANIGDNANVMGIQRLLREDLGRDISFTNEDMLEYRGKWGRREYTGEDFIDLVNAHDLLVIGGGGLFSPDRRQPTGCPVGLTVQTLERIEIPVVYYALGFASYPGERVPAETRDAFAAYLPAVVSRDRTLVSVRNDGSRARLAQCFSSEVIAGVETVPDGGFYVPTSEGEHKELPARRPVIAVQLAGDKQRLRFSEPDDPLRRASRVLGLQCDGLHSRKQLRFLRAFTAVIEELFSEAGCSFVFVPHIPADLSIIHRAMAMLPIRISRAHSSVAPVVTGEAAARGKFDFYSKVDLVIGMRFHSNVCSVGLEVPTVGLGTHPQLAGLYGELGIPERCVEVADPHAGSRITKLAREALSSPGIVREEYRRIAQRLRETSRGFHARIARLLEHGRR